MKRRLLALMLTLLVALSLAACGSKSEAPAASADMAYPMETEMATSEEYLGFDSGSTADRGAAHPTGQKLIRTAQMNLETTSFEEAVQGLTDLTEQMGGYFESSSVGKRNSGRWAEYTVRIPAEKSGYTWNFIIDDESVLELLTCEATEGTFVASFRALNDGESQIIFSYVRNDALDEARILEVRCAGGKVTEVTPDDLEEINGTWEDDPEIADLRETNALLNVLKEHSAVTCVSESWDGENNWQYKTVTQFILNGGRLWYDYEQYDEGDQVTYCEAGYINDDVPGALYMVETEGGKYMDICPSDEYETFIADQWLRRTAGDYELYVESETDEEYGNTTVTARRVNDVTGVCADVLYVTDSTTGLINGMEVTEYSSEDPAQAVSVTRSNIMYDEPRLMEERAAMAVLFPEDPCYLTVVVNPGQENEEEQSYQVDKSTLVEFEALEDFQLFYDVDCTEEMDWIDVGQNKLTVYVVPDISK